MAIYIVKPEQKPGTGKNRVGDKSGVWRVAVYKKETAAAKPVLDHISNDNLDYESARSKAAELQQRYNEMTNE